MAGLPEKPSDIGLTTHQIQVCITVTRCVSGYSLALIHRRTNPNAMHFHNTIFGYVLVNRRR